MVWYRWDSCGLVRSAMRFLDVWHGGVGLGWILVVRFNFHMPVAPLNRPSNTRRP